MLRPVYSRVPAAATAQAPALTDWSLPAPAVAMHRVTADPDEGAKSVVAFLFGVLLLVRLCLTDPIMNGFVRYSDDGGSLLEKIHPATYGMVALLVFSLLRFRFELTVGEARIARQLLILIGVIIGLSIALQVIGRSVSMGYLLETYICACLIGVLMLTFTPSQRLALGQMVLCYIAVNSLLAIAEKASGQRLLPYPYEEDSFRPTALTAHPLHIGLIHAGTIVFILGARWGAMIKGGLILLVVLGTFAAGARTGAIIASLAAVAGLMVTPMGARSLEGRVRLKALIVIGLLAAGPILLLIADSAGFLERFYGGYFDENAKARVDVYKVFDWVSTNEILFGTDLIRIREMVFERLGLLIESSVVVFVFQFGLFGAILLAGTIIWTLLRAAWGREPRAFIAVGAFLATASSNDAMSGKHAYFMLMIVMLLAFRNEGRDAFGRGKTLRWENRR